MSSERESGGSSAVAAAGPAKLTVKIQNVVATVTLGMLSSYLIPSHWAL
jgi:hypothetical protein